jgi:DNA-binding MarR family transcriptional regulator
MRSRHRVKQEDRASGVLFPISRRGPFQELTAREWRQDLLLSWLFQTCIRVQTSLNRVFSRHGMTLQEASVLLRCIETGRIAPVRLAVIVGRDRGKITRFVKRLEAASLIRRVFNSQDKRSFGIQPTADGRRVGREVASAFRKIRKELFSEILEANVERLGQMLPQLYKNAARLGSGRLATGKTIRRRIGSRRLKQEAKAHSAWEADRAIALRADKTSMVSVLNGETQSVAKNLPEEKPVGNGARS